MNAETRQIVETELTRFAADLHLSDAQKAQLKTALETAREKLDEACEKNPNLTRADVLAKLISHTRQVLHEAEALVQQRHARREDEAERAAGRPRLTRECPPSHSLSPPYGS